MIQKRSQWSAGTLRTELARLRRQKAALDDLIQSLEQYLAYTRPVRMAQRCRRPKGSGDAKESPDTVLCLQFRVEAG
jgi:hypothetical protein